MIPSSLQKRLKSELKELFRPFERSLWQPHHVQGFFTAIGWNMRGLTTADLALLREKFSAIHGTLFQFIKNEPLSQSAIDALGIKLQEDFDALGKEVIKASVNNVSDQHMLEFTNDVGHFIFILFLSKKYTLLFQLAQLLGLIKYENRTAIHIETETPGDKAILRSPGKSYRFETDGLLELPSRFLNDFIANIDLEIDNSIDRIIAVITEKANDFFQESEKFYQDALAEGIQIRIDPGGISIEGNIFGFNQLSEPVSFLLPPQQKILLQINEKVCSLRWEELIKDLTSSLSVINISGINLILENKATFTNASELIISLSDTEKSFVFSGKAGFELPADLIYKVDTNFSSSASFLFSYSPGENYSFELKDLQADGEFKIGGDQGLLLSQSNVQISNVLYPFPPQGFQIEFDFEGQLSWTASDQINQMQVHGKYAAGVFQVKVDTTLHLGQGIWLKPIPDQPLLQGEFVPGSNLMLAVNAMIIIPQQNSGTMELAVQGEMVLDLNNSVLELISFQAASKVDNLNLELPGGIVLQKAGAGISFNDDNFKAKIHGDFNLSDTTIHLMVELQFPDLQDPENIKIESGAAFTNLNFYNHLFLFEGQLQLKVTTKPLQGKLNIIEAEGGLFAKNNLGQHPGLTDFHLVVNELTAGFEFNTNAIGLELQQGKLLLPEIFHYGLQDRAEIAITGQPFSFILENQQLSFNGSFELQNLGVAWKNDEDTGFTALLDSAILVVDSEEKFPSIQNAAGSITIPVPERDPLEVVFADLQWNLTGFPSGSVFLGEDLDFELGGGFKLKIAGGTSDGIQTGLTILPSNDTFPTIQIDGAMQFLIPVEMLSGTDGDELIIGTSGNLRWSAGELPTPTLETISLGGDFRLGGPDGVQIRESMITATGIANMLNPSPAKPFSLMLSGKLYLGEEGPGAGLEDASFTFTGPDYPLFDFQGFYIKPGEELLQSIEQLPLKVKDLAVSFIEPDPLPARLNPTNIRVTLSAELDLPLSDGGSILGMVDDISVHFNDHGLPVKKDGSPGIDLGGIGVGIDGFDAGGILISGVLYLGGLDQPQDLFLAGKVGGKFNGMGVSGLLAFGLKGPRGFCLDVNAGTSGIPLVYGFLLTGAEGGVIFPNLDGVVSNADPCEIRTYIELDADGKPHRTSNPPPQSVQIPEDEQVIQNDAIVEDSVMPDFDCPQGDCPPPAVSIISQPHPDRNKYPDRVIIKFTSIDEPTLQILGITPSFFAQGGLSTPMEMAEATAGQLFDLIASAMPELSSLPMPPETLAEMESIAVRMQQNARSMLVRQLSESIGQALLGNSSVYEAVKEVVYAGIPSPETTLKLTGTFSYTGVSVFLSVTGGFSFSTVMIPQPVPLISTVGILGSINVLGIPMGTARLFLNTTDANGIPLTLPTICGDVFVGVGPLELGMLRLKFQAEGLTDGLTGAGMLFAQHLSAPLINELLAIADAELVQDPEYDENQPGNALANLSLQQLVAFTGALMNLPPHRVTPDVKNCLTELMQNAWQSFQPTFSLCGQVQPKLFGFALGGELMQARINITKNAFAARFGMSPSFILSYYFGGMFPAFDLASVGMAFELPDPLALFDRIMSTGHLSANQAPGILEEGFEHVLTNAVYTVEYEFSPMGLKMVDAEGRLMMPDLLNHPAWPYSNWTRLEDIPGQSYPSRVEILMQSLNANALANPLWKGTAEELAQLTANATSTLSFQDYFPHGGFLGAARMSLPLVLLDGLPPALLTDLLRPGTDLWHRFSIAKQILENYILKTENIGELAFYVPFPNPPTMTIDGQDPTPLNLIRKMQQDGFDWTAPEFGQAISTEEAFIKGHIQQARLLGIPVMAAEVTGYGPDAVNGTDGRLEIVARVPDGSWLQQFVTQAEMKFVLSQAPVRPVKDYFTEILTLMDYYQHNSGSNSASTHFVEIYSDTDFKGDVQKLSPGTYRASDLQIGNDALSSIYIPPDTGLQVLLYENDNFQGRNIVLTGSVNGLGNFNEVVSSIKVIRKNPLDNIQNLIIEGLPKMMMEASVASFQIPASLSQFIQVNETSSLSIKAYSPFYDPEAPGDRLEYKLKRTGGIVFSFQCVFTVPGLFEIDVPTAHFAFIPFSAMTKLPRILGELEMDKLQLPSELPDLEQCKISYDSLPAAGEKLVIIKARTSKVNLGLLTLVPVRGEYLNIQVNVKGPAGKKNEFRFDSVKIADDGWLRSDLIIHGTNPGDPITIRSAGYWNATLRGRSIAIFHQGIQVLQLKSRGLLAGSLSGKGFSVANLLIQLAGGVHLIAFPDLPVLKQRLQLLPRTQNMLAISSDGTFSLDAAGGPFVFGLIRISGVSGQTIKLRLSQYGFAIHEGAQFELNGFTLEPFTLSKLSINLAGDFKVKASGGIFGAAKFFELLGGQIEINSKNSKTEISVSNPSFTLFPGSRFRQTLKTANFKIDSKGNFALRTNRQKFLLPGMMNIVGTLEIQRNHSAILFAFKNANITLIPLGLNLKGTTTIDKQGMQAYLSAGTFKVQRLIEIKAGNWHLDWQFGDSFRTSANLPKLTIFNHQLTTQGKLIFKVTSSKVNLKLSTSDYLKLLPGLMEIGPAKVTFDQSASGTRLEMSAQLRCLKNPIGGNWILSQNTKIKLHSEDFKEEIIAFRNKVFMNNGLLNIYTNQLSRCYFGRKGDKFYFDFSKLKMQVLGITGTVAGGCDTAGNMNLDWDGDQDLKLGKFRFPNRKVKVSLDLKNQGFTLKIPAGKLTATNISGFPNAGIKLPEIKLVNQNNFILNLGAFTFKGISLSASGSQNQIRLLSHDNKIQIKNKKSLWGTQADLKLDIQSNGTVTGSLKGSFSLSNVTVGSIQFPSINAGSITMNYNNASSNYQFTGSVILNNVSGKKKKTTKKNKNVWNMFARVWETVTETVVSWVNASFKIKVLFKYGSSGAKAEVEVL